MTSDLMPGAFYTRAFIKQQIADTAGLDGAALLEEHASEIPASCCRRQLLSQHIRLLRNRVHV